ncbi:hypothetical protein TYRP_022675, partial [Tyrophagus putrescentiae]
YSTFLRLSSYCEKTLKESEPQFSKLVIVLIDALRVDFLPTVAHSLENRLNHDHKTREKTSSPPPVPRMPWLEEKVITSGISLTSVAQMPTVTLPRLKALLSGSVPSFRDYVLNLNAYAFTSDNLISSLATSGRRIVFYGDDTWGKLFPSENSPFIRSELTSSFFVSDTVTVDTNVTRNVDLELQDLDSWDVMVLHYLGLDHIGHGHGYHSPLMDDKLLEMDQVVERIYGSLEAGNLSALLVVTGDHGMTNGGNHGGATREETHTPLIFLSTSKKHKRKRFGYKNLPRPQIDFTSTLASLFRLPIPAFNKGVPIDRVLGEPVEVELCAKFTAAAQLQSAIPGRTKVEDPILFEELKNTLERAMRYHELHLEGYTVGKYASFSYLKADEILSSTSFIQSEHRFWNTAAGGIVTFLIFSQFIRISNGFNNNNSHHHFNRKSFTFYMNIAFTAVLAYLTLTWRQTELTTQWGDAPEGDHQNDLYSMLKRPENSGLATLVFVLSLVGLGWSLDSFGNVFLKAVQSSGLCLAYLYRLSTGSLLNLLPSFINNLSTSFNPNTFAQLLYLHAALLLLLTRFVIYLVMASSAFFAIGNSNSLSTVSVTACFIGLNSYQLLPCTLLMLLATYSTHLFWLLAFFRRLQQEFISFEKEFTENTKFIRSELHRLFNSLLTCWMLIRLGVMTAVLVVTLALQDHPFIWSVLSPKILYEILLFMMHLIAALAVTATFVPSSEQHLRMDACTHFFAAPRDKSCVYIFCFCFCRRCSFKIPVKNLISDSEVPFYLISSHHYQIIIMTESQQPSTKQASSTSSLARYRHIRTASSATGQQHVYLDVELEHSKSFQPLEGGDDLRFLIHSSIARLFGEAGYAIQFEVLKFRTRPSTRAFLRVLAKDYVRFRIALQLTTGHSLLEENATSSSAAAAAAAADTPQCWFKIHKAAHSLASLAFKWDIGDHIGNDDDGGGGLALLARGGGHHLRLLLHQT